MIGGNIHNKCEEWSKITKNPTVLQWITEGIPLDFDALPEPYEHRNNIFKKEEKHFLDQKIKDLTANGCISVVDKKPTCVSRISTVPKKGGSFRIVTDLRQVNNCLTKNNLSYMKTLLIL